MRAHDLAFIDCSDECLGIDDDAGGEITRDIAISNVKVSGARDIVLRIGVAGPWREGNAEVEKVSVSGLEVEWTEKPRYWPIVIAEARDVTLQGLRLSGTGERVGGLISFPGGPARHRTNIVLKDIVATIPRDEVLILIPPDIALGKAVFEVSNVTCEGGQLFAFAAGVIPNNPNMRIEGRAVAP